VAGPRAPGGPGGGPGLVHADPYLRPEPCRIPVAAQAWVLRLDRGQQTVPAGCRIQTGRDRRGLDGHHTAQAGRAAGGGVFGSGPPVEFGQERARRCPDRGCRRRPVDRLGRVRLDLVHGRNRPGPLGAGHGCDRRPAGGGGGRRTEGPAHRLRAAGDGGRGTTGFASSPGPSAAGGRAVRRPEPSVGVDRRGADPGRVAGDRHLVHSQLPGERLRPRRVAGAAGPGRPLRRRAGPPAGRGDPAPD
jgi:hypothetical protein